MSAQHERAADPRRQRTIRNATGWVIAGVVAVFVITQVASCGGSDSSTSVEMPTSQDEQELSEQLAIANEHQGVCYGWILTDRNHSNRTSHGSNFGSDAPLAEQPDTECPNGEIQVEVRVSYTSESSSSPDSATLSVETSDVTGADDDLGNDLEQALQSRFGLDEDALIDQPIGSTARAALALPLLLAERGLVEPVPPDALAATDSPSGTPDAGSDFWRDRMGVTLVAIGALLLAGLIATIGVRSWRRSRRPATEDGATPPPSASEPPTQPTNER